MADKTPSPEGEDFPGRLLHQSVRQEGRTGMQAARDGEARTGHDPARAMGLFERKIRELRVLDRLYNRTVRLFKAALWDNVELLEDLLQEEVHLIDCLDSWGRAPIHAAAITADSRCLPMLIHAGANINATCGPRCDNKTALHLSAEHGHVSNIKVLLDAGASFIAKDSNGLTALDLAERSGHEACVELLKEAAGKFPTNSFLSDDPPFTAAQFDLYLNECRVG
uniref:ANK_REP_REGION domain-containing protein n=1 Tax=Anopheles atroparvus TaxID=41427 RepID=A0A182JJD1_ANOAO